MALLVVLLLAPYQSLNRLSSVNVVFGGNTNSIGYIPSNVGNPDLKWEKTTQWDVGLDFGILGGGLKLYCRLLLESNF